MNKCSRVIEKEEVEMIVDTIQNGFKWKGVSYRPNRSMATILLLQANTGLRVSDETALRLNDIKYEAGRYHLDIVERKTGKRRTFPVAPEIVDYLQKYALEEGIRPAARLFDISTREVQKILQKATEHLGLPSVGTHSFRKFFAVSVYNASGYNIELVRNVLLHSNVNITQRYIGVSSKEIEDVLQKHVCLPDTTISDSQ